MKVDVDTTQVCVVDFYLVHTCYHKPRYLWRQVITSISNYSSTHVHTCTKNTSTPSMWLYMVHFASITALTDAFVKLGIN